MRAAALWVAGLLCAACGPADGTRRPLVLNWPESGTPPTPRCVTEELRTGGSWVKDGPVVFYDRAGRETHRGQFVNGLESGPWEERDHATDEVAKGAYTAGRRSGEWRYLRADGTLSERGSYVDGQRTGIWERFHPSGAREAEVEWRADRRHGRATFWDAEGGVIELRSGRYEDGERVGD